MTSWPVVVTNACADQCMRELGLAEREQARAWLVELVHTRGRVVADLPAPLRGRRSPSGYFCVIDGMVALPLAADRQGGAQWIATSCVLFPGYRRRYGSAARQLAAALGADARASRRPPNWCRTRRADFYLVAREEFCLPMSAQGSGGKAFDATTCLHRAADLFLLRGRELAARCAPVDDRLTDRLIDQGRSFRLDDMVTETSHLSWTPPDWARRQWARSPWARAGSEARFWLVVSDRCTVPVAWTSSSPTPLQPLGVLHRRGPIRRLLDLLRRRRP
jgi:hypothetical protein